MINFELPYQLNVSVIRDKDYTLHPELFTFTQEKYERELLVKNCINVCVDTVFYIVNYYSISEKMMMDNEGKIYLKKDACDTDLYFQQCTVHPFCIEDMEAMINVIKNTVLGE